LPIPLEKSSGQTQMYSSYIFCSTVWSKNVTCPFPVAKFSVISSMLMVRRTIHCR
jgi:hypothetical protein